ncbi:unnamed protein product [Rhizoctonia solani]|uniref:Nephrocystin 3-like N-terminal domain-containing protein n=1 Tax=Rhizoctonia solani TaxID=456999 RepID=A0A8H2XN59_9AGAM|nr:unnamed protein product [Rhizoctonia solani]
MVRTRAGAAGVTHHHKSMPTPPFSRRRLSLVPPDFRTTNDRKDHEDLADGIKAMVVLLIQHLQDATPEIITNSIKDVAEAIRREVESIDHRPHGGVRRMLGAINDEEGLTRRYRRIEQLFRQLQGEASLSTWNITSKHFVNTQLESLRPAKLARYKSELSIEVSRRACTENTRTEILANIIEWSENRSVASIYWMNGMAGTGKTTIAYSACVALEASKQLAASFFCTRTSPECRDAKRMVPTIAYQLARQSTPFRSALCHALEENPDISAEDISTQFDLLLKKPLAEAKNDMPNNLVVVIDGLDECNDPYIVELFLGLLFRVISGLPIKFFVTSRPEPVIRQRMMLESEFSRSILHLHEIEKSLVQADIELYLKEELSFMAPANDDVRQLADHAGNLFIYAATAIRYIRPAGRLVNSRERLATVLAVDAKAKKRLSDIDILYSTILTAAIEDENLEPEEQEHMRLALWTTVCACEPLLIKTLAAISGIGSKDAAMAALDPLRSVLHILDHDDVVTTLHASFPDYILSQERSGRFYCNVPIHSQLITAQCFEIMKTQLRFNICSIQSSFIPDDKIPNLKEQIKNISEELFYVCRFWADHLSLVEASDPLLDTLYDFLTQYLLFWMEVLNLKKCIDTGVTVTIKLNSWLIRRRNIETPKLSKLRDLASDIHNFVLGFASHPISKFTPHIYLSALPFASSLKYLFSCYIQKFKGLIRASGSALNKVQQVTLWAWNCCCSATFSPKGDRIALGSLTGELCIRNAYDGKYVIRPFKAHSLPIVYVRYSHDGARIVTGSRDTTLSVWSTQDGMLIFGPFTGHTDCVTSVDFSPDAKNVVSGSDDCTVRIWSLHNIAAPPRQLIGHTKEVKSIAVSPEGTRIASGSFDQTIRIWDIASGATIHTLLGHHGLVTSVQFAPDGAKIISLSPCGYPYNSETDICIWDASNGSLCQRLNDIFPQKIEAMTISPDGGHVVASLDTHSINVWDRHSGKLVAGPFEGHFGRIQSIEFSDDGTRFISASQDDQSVRVWNLYAGGKARSSEKLVIWPNPNPVIPAFAPSQAYVAISGSTHIQVFDLNLNGMKYIESQVDSQIKHLQFSLDGSLIFSVHSSGTMCTWNTHTTQLVGAPHRCSTYGDLVSAACSADGTRVVTRARTLPDQIELWDAQFNRTIGICRMNREDHYIKIIFSQRGRSFLTSSDTTEHGTFEVWDMDNGARIARPFSKSLALDFSPDGAHVVCLPTTAKANRTVRLINVSNREHKEMPLENRPTRPLRLQDVSAIFSSDGLHLAGTICGRGYIWNTLDQTVVSILTHGCTRFRSITYSPDGWCLASGICERGRGEALRFWRFHTNNSGPTAVIGGPPDGWIRDSEHRPMFWVHPAIRDELPLSHGVFIEKDESLYVDCSNLLVGNDWGTCYMTS